MALFKAGYTLYNLGSRMVVLRQTEIGLKKSGVTLLQPNIACDKILNVSKIWDDHLIARLRLRQQTNRQKWL